MLGACTRQVTQQDASSHLLQGKLDLMKFIHSEEMIFRIFPIT